MGEEIKQCSYIACKQHIEYNKSIRGIRKAPVNKCIDQKEMNKEFTKKDLKSGMWIECRNGNKYLLMHDKLDGKLWGYRDAGKIRTEDLNDNLTFIVGQWDIMKVWHYDNPMNNNEVDFGTNGLIWERNTKQDQIKSKINEIQAIVDDMQDDIKQKLESINKLKEELK